MDLDARHSSRSFGFFSFAALPPLIGEKRDLYLVEHPVRLTRLVGPKTVAAPHLRPPRE